MSRINVTRRPASCNHERNKLSFFSSWVYPSRTKRAFFNAFGSPFNVKKPKITNIFYTQYKARLPSVCNPTNALFPSSYGGKANLRTKLNMGSLAVGNSALVGGK